MSMIFLKIGNKNILGSQWLLSHEHNEAVKTQLTNENVWTSKAASQCRGSLKPNRTGRTVADWEDVSGEHR